MPVTCIKLYFGCTFLWVSLIHCWMNTTYSWRCHISWHLRSVVNLACCRSLFQLGVSRHHLSFMMIVIYHQSVTQLCSGYEIRCSVHSTTNGSLATCLINEGPSQLSLSSFNWMDGHRKLYISDAQWNPVLLESIYLCKTNHKHMVPAAWSMNIFRFKF